MVTGSQAAKPPQKNRSQLKLKDSRSRRLFLAFVRAAAAARNASESEGLNFAQQDAGLERERETPLWAGLDPRTLALALPQGCNN